MLGEAAVGFAQDRIVQGGLEHRRLEVVEHDPGGHAAEALEGAAMQAQPGGDLLVEDQLGVLVAAEGEGHDEDVGGAQLAAPRVEEGASRAEVDLSLLARQRMDTHGDRGCGGRRRRTKRRTEE